MKNFKNNKYFKICLCVFLTAAVIIVFTKFVTTSDNLWQSALRGLDFLRTLLAPFITAIVIAYLLHPAVQLLEKLFKKMDKKQKAGKFIHILSILLIYIVLLAIITVLVYFTIPQISANASELRSMLPTYYNKILEWIDSVNAQFPWLQNENSVKYTDLLMLKAREAISSGLNNGVNTITAHISNLFSKVLNFMLGLIMSIYLLNESSSVLAKLRRTTLSLLGEPKGKQFLSFISAVDKVFSRFITAKLLEVLSVYVLAQISFILLGVPFNVLCAVLVALTNLIPYIGPWIGGIAPVLLSFVNKPIQALYVMLILIGIQIVDNYIVSPIITGDQIGLSPFWVMFATLLFGKLFGLTGMVLAAPLAAVMTMLLRQFLRYLEVRRAQKKSEEQKKTIETQE